MKVDKCNICGGLKPFGKERCTQCAEMLSNYELNPGDIERAKEAQEELGIVDFRSAFIFGVVVNWGGFDGGHHKAWALDQVARLLTGPRYKDAVEWAKDGEEGPETYSYDEGIAP